MYANTALAELGFVCLATKSDQWQNGMNKSKKYFKIRIYVADIIFFFEKILSTDSCLHTLLPPERNNKIFSKLRNPLKYLISFSRTKKYQTFLNYALANFQNSI